MPTTAHEYPFSLEAAGPLSFFLRTGRIETYARRVRERSWAWVREPGSLEVDAGRFRLTVAWAAPSAETPKPSIRVPAGSSRATSEV